MAPFQVFWLLPLANAVRTLEKDAVEVGGVEITQTWPGVGKSFVPVFDVTNLFLTEWKAIPLNSMHDFKMTGDLLHMVKLLQMRPELPIECHSTFINQSVYFTVNEVPLKARELFLRAFVGGWVQIGGVASLMTRIASVIRNTAASAYIAIFASNPSVVNLDNAVKKIMESDLIQRPNGNPITPKTIYHWLTGRETIAYLSLKNMNRLKKSYSMAKFACVKNEGQGLRDRPAFVAMDDGTGAPVPLTAQRLSVFLLALA